MEQQKKRHNPEITQEDLAVKAFDRLENIVQEAKNSSQTVEAVKTDNALVKDFYTLVTKVFGEELVKENKNTLTCMSSMEGFDSKEGIYLGVKSLDERIELEKFLEDPKFIDSLNQLNGLYKKKKDRWYQKKKPEKYLSLEIDIPEQVIKSDAGELPKLKFIVENGKYNPIKITAHTTEALREARVFVKAYEALTGKKATLIQDCEDEEPIKEVQKEIKTLEQKVKEPSKQVKIAKEMGRTSKDLLIGCSKGVWKATKFMIGGTLFFPTRVRQEYEGEDTVCKNNLSYSIAKNLAVPPTNLATHIGFILLSYPLIQNGNWEAPAIYFGANAASGLYELYRHSRNKVEEEERWKR